MAKQSLSLECRCKICRHKLHADFDETALPVRTKPARRRHGCAQVPVSRLLLAAKSSGNFAQQLVLLRPARLERPGEDLLELVAVVHGCMKKNNVGAFFGST